MVSIVSIFSEFSEFSVFSIFSIFSVLSIACRISKESGVFIIRVEGTQPDPRGNLSGPSGHLLSGKVCVVLCSFSPLKGEMSPQRQRGSSPTAGHGGGCVRHLPYPPHPPHLPHPPPKVTAGISGFFLAEAGTNRGSWDYDGGCFVLSICPRRRPGKKKPSPFRGRAAGRGRKSGGPDALRGSASCRCRRRPPVGGYRQGRFRRTRTRRRNRG